MRRLLVVLGVPIDNLTMEEALERCDAFIVAGRTSGHTHQIATVNANFVVNSLLDPELRRILQEADMTTADGMPLVWASRLLGDPLPGRVTGVDLVPVLAARAVERGYSIYFLGAREGVAARAAAMLQRRYPGLKVAGVYSPPPASVLTMDRTVVERVRDARPDILLVAFGNPKQEKWIRMYAPELQVPVCIGVGGALDMIAGTTRRAPLWMQQSGLEWIYRLAQEPRRLFKRYLHDCAYFSYFFARQWWAMHRGRAAHTLPSAVGHTPTLVETPAGGRLPVIAVRGRLDAASSDQFLQCARDSLERATSLVVNLAATEFVDSTGMGALVATANHARAAGGSLYLVEVPHVIADLLALVQLEHFFEILPDSQAAEHRFHTPDVPAEPLLCKHGWAVIRAPRLFDGNTAPLLLEHCQQRIAELHHLVVDLSETVFLASAGIATLIKLDRLCREQGGHLYIASSSANVLRTLRLLQLDVMLRVFPTVEAALATSIDRPAPHDADRKRASGATLAH